MPQRADGYQASAGFTADATLYDGSTATGYERTAAISNIAITGKLDIGPSPTPVKKVTGFVKWQASLSYICEYSNDDISYSTTPGTYTATTLHNGVYSGAQLTFTATSALSARYWRWSVKDTYNGFGSLNSTIGLMELEALDVSGIHIPEVGSAGPMALDLVGVCAMTADTQKSYQMFLTLQGVAASTLAMTPGGYGMQCGFVGAAKMTSVIQKTYSMALALTGVADSAMDMSGGGITMQCAMDGSSDMTGQMSGSLAGMSVAFVGAASGKAQSGLTVLAQSLFDYVEWYPGCGDIWGHSDGKPYDNNKYGGAIELRAGKVLRGAAWGLMLNGTDNTPLSGATVELSESKSGDIRGSGGSDASGEYATGNPNARNGLDHTVTAKAGDTPYPTGAFKAHARKRERISFKITPPAKNGLSYDVSVSGRHYRTFVKSGKVQVGYALDLALKQWNDRDSGISGNNPFLRVERADRRQRLWLVYETGSNIGAQVSSDEGGSWTNMGTIANNAKHPCLCITRQGTYHYFWWDSKTIKGKVFDAFGNTLIDTFTAVGGGVDDDSIDAQDSIIGGGQWRIALVYRSSNNLTVALSTDGQVFN